MNLLNNPEKRKWMIVVTIFIAIICNYLDRQLLSILKPTIKAAFDMNDDGYAFIVNIFLICYAVMYPISGILVDRFGPKKVMFWASWHGRRPASEAAFRPIWNSSHFSAGCWGWPSPRSSPGRSSP